jgi:hypothetical protein
MMQKRKSFLCTEKEEKLNIDDQAHTFSLSFNIHRNFPFTDPKISFIFSASGITIPFMVSFSALVIVLYSDFDYGISNNLSPGTFSENSRKESTATNRNFRELNSFFLI